MSGLSFTLVAAIEGEVEDCPEIQSIFMLSSFSSEALGGTFSV